MPPYRWRAAPDPIDREAVARHLAAAAEAAGCLEELAELLQEQTRGLEERRSARREWSDIWADMERKGEQAKVLRGHVQRFVRDCCELGPDLRSTGRELHRAYLDWSGLHRADRCSVQQFGAALMAVGRFGRDRSAPAQGFRKVWLGIGLRSTKGEG